jgi:Ca2+-binding EF-hand superfamily protein
LEIKMKTKPLIAGVISSVLALSLSVGTAAAQDSDQDAHDAKHDQHQGKMMHKMRKHHKQHVKERILKMDTNGDGKIDLGEYMSNAENRFNEMDADGDQYVTPDEAREMHRNMRKRHQDQRSKMHDEMEEAPEKDS